MSAEHFLSRPDTTGKFEVPCMIRSTEQEVKVFCKSWGRTREILKVLDYEGNPVEVSEEDMKMLQDDVDEYEYEIY